MKVLFITHCTTMGGANQSMLQLIKELKHIYNIEIEVIVPKTKNEDSSNNIIGQLRKENIPFITSRYNWFKLPDNQGLLSKFKSIIYFIINWTLYYPYLLYQLRNKKYDIIHSNASVIDVGVYISIFKRTKHIWHLREFGDWDFNLKSIIGDWYNTFIYNTCSNLIAISEIVKKRYSEYVNPNQIRLIYNGISTEKYNNPAMHNNKYIQFCCCGNVHPSKNQLEILKATNILVNKMGVNNFRINIIGQESLQYKQELIEYINKNNLCNYVIFHGMKNNIPEILEKMDVGLMVSNNEAFGRVTIEYMFQNLCVIANDSGANKEILCDDNIGIIYPKGNINLLAEKMKYLIINKSIIISMASKANQHARNHFSSKINTNRIYKYYLEILNKNQYKK